jgi:DUF4097 and DUF4098 domain-containing protein YvlB
MRRFFLASAAFLLPAAFTHTPALAQNFTTAPCQGDNNSHSGWFGHGEQACELRSTVLPVSNGQVNVSGRNGGIEVIGEDRRDIALEAKVTAQGSSHEDAEARLHQIRVLTSGEIHAEGPGESGDHRGWSVSYKLHVPRHIAANLRTENGGITVADIDGAVKADTTNGGLSLRGLAGTVHAQTTNGGVDVTLAGERWHGDGLFAKSTNGGISVRVPDHFAAHLVASTVNGGLAVGFPLNGQDRPRRSIETDLNGGGPPVRLETTNGGVSIARL